MNDTIRACLEHVRKPARYTGGEYNAVYKDKSQVDLRFAFCFPDIYEIGMSHLGSKILYGLLNRPGNKNSDTLLELPSQEDPIR